MGMTITEALAEVKLIDKKIASKKDFILSFLIRPHAMRDPLGDSGGSRQVLEAERQAIKDLFERKVAIRRAIQQANASTEVTVEGETRTIADWLVWRREVAPMAGQLLREFKGKIDQARNAAAQNRVALVPADKEAEGAGDLLVNLSEKKLAERAQHLETVLGVLDGQLSLKNATVQVEV